MSWLETSINKSKKLKDHYKLRGVDIFIKDALDEDIDFDFVVRYVSVRLPDHLLRNVDINPDQFQGYPEQFWILQEPLTSMSYRTTVRPPFNLYSMFIFTSFQNTKTVVD